MNRIDVLNLLIQKNNLTKFCEIGVQAGDCFRGVQCETKIGVDPDPLSAATHHVTSDYFFEEIMTNNKKYNIPEKFDIFWIDGLHESPQVEKDILNALNYLNEGGFVCCHDMLPTTKHMQEIPLTDQSEWTGDCWRAWLKLRTTRPDLKMTVLDLDWGTSIIQKGKQEIVVLNKPIQEVTYEDFVQNKTQWMNIISKDEFISRLAAGTI